MFKRLLERFSRRSIQNPAVPLTSKVILDYLGSGLRTTSGMNVGIPQALSYSPVWAAVDMISSDVSRLPFLTYERIGDGKRRAAEHPTYRLLRRHTGEMTSNLWLSRMVGQSLLYGDGYSIIERGADGSPRGLRWIHHDRVICTKERGQVFYIVKNRPGVDTGPETARYTPTDVFHLVGLTLDELGGMSLIAYARNTVGRQLASEQFGDDFFSNSAVPSGWFSHPGEMSQEAQRRFLEAFEARHAGSGKRHRAGVLEEGMSWTPATVSPKDALLVDSLKWGVKDVARFFNLPGHRLGDDSRTSFSSLEQENRSYFDTTLGKWVSRLESEANEKLFSETEKLADSHFAEFLQDALFKADMAARHQSYATAIQWGWMSRNEVRARENLNPYDGGDDYLTPLNMQMGEEDEEEPEEEDEPEDDDSPELEENGAREGLRLDMRFCARMLANAARESSSNGGSRFWAFLNSYGDRYRDKILKILEPRLAACGASQSTRTVLVDEFLSGTTDAFLRASECGESELRDRVREALPDLYGLCDRILAKHLERVKA